MHFVENWKTSAFLQKSSPKSDTSSSHGSKKLWQREDSKKRLLRMKMLILSTIVAHGLQEVTAIAIVLLIKNDHPMKSGEKYPSEVPPT